jgi:hypothetical protein
MAPTHAVTRLVRQGTVSKQNIQDLGISVGRSNMDRRPVCGVESPGHGDFRPSIAMGWYIVWLATMPALILPSAVDIDTRDEATGYCARQVMDYTPEYGP